MASTILAEGFFSKTIWENGWLYWWQVPAIILLIAIIIFWVRYRRQQM